MAPTKPQAIGELAEAMALAIAFRPCLQFDPDCMLQHPASDQGEFIRGT